MAKNIGNYEFMVSLKGVDKVIADLQRVGARASKFSARELSKIANTINAPVKDFSNVVRDSARRQERQLSGIMHSMEKVKSPSKRAKLEKAVGIMRAGGEFGTIENAIAARQSAIAFQNKLNNPELRKGVAQSQMNMTDMMDVSPEVKSNAKAVFATSVHAGNFESEMNRLMVERNAMLGRIIDEYKSKGFDANFLNREFARSNREFDSSSRMAQAQSSWSGSGVVGVFNERVRSSFMESANDSLMTKSGSGGDYSKELGQYLIISERIKEVEKQISLELKNRVSILDQAQLFAKSYEQAMKAAGLSVDKNKSDSIMNSSVMRSLGFEGLSNNIQSLDNVREKIVKIKSEMDSFSGENKNFASLAIADLESMGRKLEMIIEHEKKLLNTQKKRQELASQGKNTKKIDAEISTMRSQMAQFNAQLLNMNNQVLHSGKKWGNFAIQASYGIQDLIQVLAGGGGLRMALMASANNAGQLMTMLGGVKGAVGGIAALALFGLAANLIDWSSGSERALKGLKSVTEELEKIQKFQNMSFDLFQTGQIKTGSLSVAPLIALANQGQTSSSKMGQSQGVLSGLVSQVGKIYAKSPKGISFWNSFKNSFSEIPGRIRTETEALLHDLGIGDSDRLSPGGMQGDTALKILGKRHELGRALKDNEIFIPSEMRAGTQTRDELTTLAKMPFSDSDPNKNAAIQRAVLRKAMSLGAFSSDLNNKIQEQIDAFKDMQIEMALIAKQQSESIDEYRKQLGVGVGVATGKQLGTMMLRSGKSLGNMTAQSKSDVVSSLLDQYEEVSDQMKNPNLDPKVKNALADTQKDLIGQIGNVAGGTVTKLPDDLEGLRQKLLEVQRRYTEMINKAAGTGQESAIESMMGSELQSVMDEFNKTENKKEREMSMTGIAEQWKAIQLSLKPGAKLDAVRTKAVQAMNGTLKEMSDLMKNRGIRVQLKVN